MNSLEALEYKRLDKYVGLGYFVYYDLSYNALIIVVRNQYSRKIDVDIFQGYLVIHLSVQEFYDVLDSNFQSLATIKAKYDLEFSYNQPTAKNLAYSFVVPIGILCFFVSRIYFDMAFLIVNHLLYLSQNLLKIVLFSCSQASSNYYPSESQNLPRYTVLVPLYKETNILADLVCAIQALEYPKELLDVKLVIEADDCDMINVLSNMQLPYYFHIVRVPPSHPRTKPKALNYAMQYAHGEYVVIYDAEDRPDPKQLIKALAVFCSLPEEYVCIQARLNFYNAQRNLLTRLCSLEYSLWFEYMLPSLDNLGLPIPLGGTSNHFKMKALKSVGGWDAYNVTEDADLGLRLYAEGYKIKMLDSITLEESTSSLKSWLMQRSRWIKGFIQTCMSFYKNNKKYQTLSRFQIIITYSFVGLSSYCFFCWPWLLTFGAFTSNAFIEWLSIINFVFFLFYSYLVGLTVLKKRYKKSKSLDLHDILALVIWPVYFILHTIASYIAVLEILFKPFHWNKTEHGKK